MKDNSSPSQSENTHELAQKLIVNTDNDSKELKSFKEIKNLNWSWIFWDISGHWTQFDCVVCMIIESKYMKYLKDPSDSNSTLNIMAGTINFEKMVLKKKMDQTKI